MNRHTCPCTHTDLISKTAVWKFLLIRIQKVFTWIKQILCRGTKNMCNKCYRLNPPLVITITQVVHTFTVHCPTSDFTYEKRGFRICSSVVLPQVFSVKRSLDTNILLSLYTEGQNKVQVPLSATHHICRWSTYTSGIWQHHHSKCQPIVTTAHHIYLHSSNVNYVVVVFVCICSRGHCNSWIA